MGREADRNLAPSWVSLWTAAVAPWWARWWLTRAAA